MKSGKTVRMGAKYLSLGWILLGSGTLLAQPVAGQGTVINAQPVEINASAPKIEPDPYALPPDAPQSLVKLRTDLEKWYGVYRILASRLISGFEKVDFSVRSQDMTKLMTPNFSSTLSPGQQSAGDLPADMSLAEIMRRLEALTQNIERSQSEFLQEKEVFLTHGRVPPNGGVASAQVSQVSQVSIDKK